ncbi:septum formation protein Maf [Marinobacter sp. EhC06]|jgi:septum formation protein|uniref:Maf family protein n=1 Tax=Marinobacter TaxID=2742 RepID=UPI0007D9F187|nr:MULTISPECIES: nucleoside triphosphate pyrophosphatase [unclassified Marinobacter]OAN90122.1 septum formation protein Maf [Marinobacter sp. EhN04]OAN97161.1 septum formation protein Maf [Marinobacter sp. EhC06]
MPSIILASASPRRAELLQQIGLSFSVRPADIDETPEPDETPEQYVERLAREKALAVAGSSPECLVLGSDTSVVLEGKILGKPTDPADARETLVRLSGATHQVMTAVALATEGQCQSVLVITEVCFRQLSTAEIEAYVASGEPMDKAGSYGIQGLGGIFVNELRGSYSAVVGLPLQETAALLAGAGYPVWKNWPRSLESQTL